MKEVFDIDIPTTYKDIDREGMMEKVFCLPQQIESSTDFLEKIDIPKIKPVNVLILGMGGSGIGGNLIASQYRNELKIPIMSSQSYDIPAAVGKDTLTIAVSYSGNTEETLTAFEESRKRGGHHISITSGGQLKKESEKIGAPVVYVPPGLPPRSAIGYLYASLIHVFEELELISNKERERRETLKIMKAKRDEWKPIVPMSGNSAKQCALRILGKIPIIYGSNELTAAIAYRWKCQFNENSKILSYTNVLPEMNHNEIVGWSNKYSDQSCFHIIFLREHNERVEIKKRVAFTKELVSKKTTTDEFFTMGESSMARMMSLVYLGDFVSVYIAILGGINPTTIDAIDDLKLSLKG